MSVIAPEIGARDDELVLAVLQNAGPRGASHEDFVEAGLARDYVGGLRRLVDERGLDIRIDFATGATRWALRRWLIAGWPTSARLAWRLGCTLACSASTTSGLARAGG